MEAAVIADKAEAIMAAEVVRRTTVGVRIIQILAFVSTVSGNTGYA